MIDYDYYIANPQEITHDLLTEVKQGKESYMVSVLLNVYHQYLREIRAREKLETDLKNAKLIS